MAHLSADTVRNTKEVDQLAAFFGWTAWTSVAQRPGDLAFGLGGLLVLLDLGGKLRFRRPATEAKRCSCRRCRRRGGWQRSTGSTRSS